MQVREYLEYLHANSVAWREGREDFGAIFRGQGSRVQTVQYRVWCRGELQRKAREVLHQEQGSGGLEEVLKEADCWEPLWRDGKVNLPSLLGSPPPDPLSSRARPGSPPLPPPAPWSTRRQPQVADGALGQEVPIYLSTDLALSVQVSAGQASQGVDASRVSSVLCLRIYLPCNISCVR